MVLPSDDQGLSIALIVGAAAAAIKIAEHLWGIWMRGRSEKRVDHAEHVVDTGYAKLVADLQRDNDRLVAKNEALMRELEKCRNGLIAMVERQNRMRRDGDGGDNGTNG